MIGGKSFFDQPKKSNKKTYDNIQKIRTGQGDDYTTGCLLDYNYFNKHYEMQGQIQDETKEAAASFKN